VQTAICWANHDLREEKNEKIFRRIFSGLNPEHAYEGAFVVRWLIQRQLKCDAALAVDEMPVLAWGPYLWAGSAE